MDHTSVFPEEEKLSVSLTGITAQIISSTYGRYLLESSQILNRKQKDETASAMKGYYLEQDKEKKN